MNISDYYYYEFIKTEGDQEKFWDAVSSEELSSSAYEKLKPEIEELIAKRADFIGRGPVKRGCIAFLDEGGFLDKLHSLSGTVYFIEWTGNLVDFEKDCIFVDEYRIFSQSWLQAIAKEYKKALMTVAPVAERVLAATAEDVVGAKYEIIVYNPETNSTSELFGEEYDCWAWAAQLSSLAFTANYGEINDKFVEYAAKYIGNKRCLAVPGNSGCHANQLIKTGWQLADCPHDIEIMLDKLKEGE